MIAVIRFPGSNCDMDMVHALGDVLKRKVKLVWHREFKGGEFDVVVLPGGFTYGDHLRAGIIAAFSPAMKEVREMAKEGKPVLGVCNGFQILTETGMLPGSLLRNDGLNFVCKWIRLKKTGGRSLFARKVEDFVSVPIAHNEGRYFIDEKGLRELEQNDQIVFKYVDAGGNETYESNPNGSLSNIAGICNPEGNVMGMMPHPERACEEILGGKDGLKILEVLK
ncbi:MAG: phosphoribosylformylglycinamidine synthase I [Candidatus Micrarchaeota archaeon]|nr:phosphoribosylformylglycinamidine synthase I [Candidatus Micrarchaeota archaeon]